MSGRGSTQTPLTDAWTLLSPPQTVQVRNQKQWASKAKAPKLRETE